MTSEKPATIIKKYANRRLYNTGTSAYVTLEDLAVMVKRGDDFVVYDAKAGDDITRSVLAQIIFEQEGKNGQSLLPISFLRQLIRFYGDSMQMLVPSYLEFSLDKLTKERGGFTEAFSKNPLTSAMMANPMADAARPIFAQIEEQTRQNVAMFRQALSMFTPAVGAIGATMAKTAASETATSQTGTSQTGTSQTGTSETATPPAPGGSHASPAQAEDATPASDARNEFDDMRRQLVELQRRMETMAPKV